MESRRPRVESQETGEAMMLGKKSDARHRGEERLVKRFAWWPTGLGLYSDTYGSPSLVASSPHLTIWMEQYDQYEMWFDYNYNRAYRWRVVGRFSKRLEPPKVEKKPTGMRLLFPDLKPLMADQEERPS